MADMTPQEQLMLELINRARMDPNGEAKRFGIKLNEGVSKSDRISGDSKQVLAGNDDLNQAADSHSDWMLDHDTFSHVEKSGTSGFTGKDPGDRMEHAGYTFSGSWGWGENISYRGSTGALDLTKEIIRQHRDLFVDKGYDGRGHRLNILSDNFQEVGVGQKDGDFKSGGTTFNASMVTQDFARTGDQRFITGVVYDDTVKDDNFFTVGEQDAGRSVNGDGPNDTTGAGGGYELSYASGGEKTVTFGGGVIVGVMLGAGNAKLDLVNDDEVWSSATITAVSTNVREVHALGIDDIDLTGSDSVAGEAMYGNKGDNVLRGRAGADTLDGGAGKDELHGDGGADVFFFAKGDTGKTVAKADSVVDFSTVEGDVIDLGRWDANTKQNGDQAFTFIGSEAFHNKAGELRAFASGGVTVVAGDINGDGQADLVIEVDNGATLTAASFDL